MQTPTHPDEPLHPDLETIPMGLLDIPESAASLRASLARRSGRVVRNRRLRRRAAAFSVLVGLYALGFLSAHLVGTPGKEGEPAEEQAMQVAGQPVPEQPAAGELRDPEFLEPEFLEHLAREGSRSGRAARLRRAGDLYLEKRGDMESALRCYSDYLALAGSETTGGETWLLTALKHDLNGGNDSGTV